MAGNAFADSWLAIDYGTSNTVAMLSYPDGRVRPMLFDGSPLLPSTVCVGANGQILTGRAAQRQARLVPESCEPNPKRRVDDRNLLLGEQSVPVVDLVAATLGRVRQEATRALSMSPSRVVITYPVEWGPARQSVLVDAARQAGLPQVVLVPEPTAAATYFATVLGRELQPGGCVVVYDLGAGTFDVSVVQRGPTGFAPLSYRGLDDFGGLDLDESVLSIAGDAVAAASPQEWQRLRSPQNTADSRAFRTLWQDATEVKEALSSQSSAAMLVPLVDREVIVGREQFEELARPRLADTVRITTQCIREARIEPQQIGGVFLVGGGTRIPLVSTLLHTALGVAPTVLDQPELVVAEGALRAMVATGEPTAPAFAAASSGGRVPAQAGPAPVSAPPTVTSVPPAPASAPPTVTSVPPAPAPVSVPPVPTSPVVGYPGTAEYAAPPGPFPPAVSSDPFPSSNEWPAAAPVSPTVAAPAPQPRRPAEFATASGSPLLRIFLSFVVGIGVSILGTWIAYQVGENHGDHWHHGNYAAAMLVLIAVPGALLVTQAFAGIARLSRRTRLHIDEAGIRVLAGDPESEGRWRAVGWAVPAVALSAVCLYFFPFWDVSDDGQWTMAVLSGIGLVGIVVAVVQLGRGQARRITWLTLHRRSPQAGDPRAVIEVDSYPWPQLRGVAVRRVGAARRQALVVVPVDRGELLRRPSVHRRAMRDGIGFVAADLTSAGIPVAPVISVLHDHAGDRLVGALAI
ncbi:Hsp70 family protein [Dactylosporangium sp. NPDC006015]|uniref:Hsp70 family protein n=1 Tax=Dactylosporangium sp. NPDC006015 TaxID=3154576 RepID=UPI0033BA551B